jgi:hypothetical protein
MIADISGQPIGPIFKGQAVQKSGSLIYTAADTRNLAKYSADCKSVFFVRP